MARRRKVNIDTNPLQSVTIGRTDTKKYGWIGTLFLFIIFIKYLKIKYIFFLRTIDFHIKIQGLKTLIKGYYWNHKKTVHYISIYNVNICNIKIETCKKN